MKLTYYWAENLTDDSACLGECGPHIIERTLARGESLTPDDFDYTRKPQD